VIYPDQHMGFSALAFACVVWLGFMVYVIRGAMRDAKASDDLIRWDAAEEFIRAEGRFGGEWECPGCDTPLTDHDITDHVRTCDALSVFMRDYAADLARRKARMEIKAVDEAVDERVRKHHHTHRGTHNDPRS